MLTVAKVILLFSSLVNCQTWYPKYHLSPQKGWMNDPNGLIYHNGYYHAFYQHYPDAPKWGLMHWGHAKSTDMLHWEHLPIALKPSLPEDIDGIFSGSAVIIDNKLTVIYTGVSKNSTKQRQMVAITQNDEDFVKLGVVIDKDEENFRDPKAWQQDGYWFTVIGSQTNEKRGEVLLYKSENFMNWTYEGQLAQANEKLGYMWECPDFFTLNGKQVLIINPQGMEPNGYDYQNLYQTGYFVGSWSPEQGSNYTIEKDFREIDHGHDIYASQTFLAPDGRRIMIGWLDMWESPFPESKDDWAGMFTLPRELTLSESGDLLVRPIREIINVRSVEQMNLEQFALADFKDLGIFHSEILIEFDLNKSTSNIFGVKLTPSKRSLQGVKVYVNRTESRLFINRNYPKYNIEATNRSVLVDLSLPSLILDIFIDSSSIEVFVNDGQAVMSSRIYPDDNQRNVYVFSEGKGLTTLGNYQRWNF